MRIRILEVDATPQEIEQTPKLRDLLGSFARAGASVPASRLEQAPDQPGRNGIPPNVLGLLERRGPGGPVRHALEQFLQETLTWEGVEPRIGVSRRNKDDPAKVIRLHRRGSGVGAFVYVELPAASLKFRLPRIHDLREQTDARAREVQPDAPYGIAVRLTPASISEALLLAKDAYQATFATVKTDLPNAARPS
jgi:hypothetical protein